MATHGGAADSYYSGAPQGYNGSNADQTGQNPGYEQSPPSYGQDFQQTVALTADGKQTFDQVFKLDRPKYNDVWAGILVVIQESQSWRLLIVLWD